MEFEKRKAATIATMNSPQPDKSPKGNIDTPIIPLLNTINSHPCFFTTSSCSGRISILSQPLPPTPTPTPTPKKKAKGGSWLFISHDPVHPNSVLPLLFPTTELTQSPPSGPPSSTGSSPVGPNSSIPITTESTHRVTTELTQSAVDGLPAPTQSSPADSNSVFPTTESSVRVDTELTQFAALGSPTSAHPHSFVFRFEPLIVAVECKDIEAAQSLVSLAISCGFRESGITSVSKRVIIAIRCSIRLEVPLGDTEKIMVSPEYVKYLIEVANEKMEANRRRTNSFLEALLKHGFSSVPQASVNNEEQVLINGDMDCNEGSVCGETEKFGSLENSSCVDAERKDLVDTKCGSSRVSGFGLSVVQMEIAGEPLERLFLWGHSASTVDGANWKKVFIFGGFGGIGRHARRNDLLLLDPESGEVEKIDVHGAPSPRLGHTSSIIGNIMYIIGGRADPMNILNDVWALDNGKREWKLLQCSGSLFPPRHRHAAAFVGSTIYVFGGIYDGVISSSLYALDTQNLAWSEIYTQGDRPCARHSHSMVVYGSQLYMFGGYNGEKVLNDLYSFDVQTYIWKKEKTYGQIPHARFSHMMFVYKNYLGILGGCPVSQNHQDLSLLDLQSHSWKHVNVRSTTQDLFVRSTANVMGDDLIIIGGGASCYAFGTKFSEPVKISLLPFLRFGNFCSPSEIKEKLIRHQQKGEIEKENGNFQQRKVELISNRSLNQDVVFESGISTGHKVVDSHWVLQLERKYAKLGKDILKKFGWLDLGRKVWSQEGGVYICFPVTEKFCAVYNDKQSSLENAFEGVAENHPLEQLCQESHLSKDISVSTALKVLKACGATKVADEVAKVKKAPLSPLTMMKEAVASLISNRGLSLQLLEQLPSRWERLGDIIVLSATSFKDSAWDSVWEELWPIIARSLRTQRLARQGRIAPMGTRDSTLEMLVGDNGWVEHCENGILYSFDATKCMFSWGNLSEKLRMGHLECTDEVIVDLFAGIGYFVLPFLVRAKAKLVYACEWNPFAVEALRRNLVANSVADHCIVLEGDNCVTAPRGVADRVCLGLLPTSEGSWVTAVRALRDKGGILHIHGNVKDTEESLWADHISNSIVGIAKSEGHCWEVSVEHIERVKWYAPHIRHLVADVRCKRI